MLFAPGVGEAAISMSGCAGTVDQVVHTIRAAGRVTRTLQGLKRGDVLGLRGPFGKPWPVRQAEGHDVLLVAGGIGLAPLRPALCHMLQHRERFGRVNLLFGARSPRDILFAKEIETWRGRFDVNVEVTVDRAERRLARPRGRGHHAHPAGPVRPGEHGGLRLRPRDHDALHAARARAARRARRAASGSRWSGT